jgi:hypothetical protein
MLRVTPHVTVNGSLKIHQQSTATAAARHAAELGERRGGGAVGGGVATDKIISGRVMIEVAGLAFWIAGFLIADGYRREVGGGLSNEKTSGAMTGGGQHGGSRRSELWMRRRGKPKEEDRKR